MIIVLSGWRGNHTVLSQVEIREAVADMLCRLFVHFPDAEYRVGDCPTGVDAAVRRLWDLQGSKTGWYRPQVSGRRRLAPPYRADWGAAGRRAGPERNRAMLRGDGTDDLVTGFASALYAMPEPGPRKPVSGTWTCMEIASELGVSFTSVPLRPAHGQDRLPHLPLPS